MVESVFADDPIQKPEDDKLERGGFAKQVVRVCRQVALQSRATTVLALIGSWGSGKSSVLELVKAELSAVDENSSDEWKIANFNPWLFSDVESLLRSFFGELAAVLPEDGAVKKTRKRIGEYAQKIAPVVKIPGYDGSGAVQRIGEALVGDMSVESRRSEIEGALSELSYKILVVVDDMDRLQPSELLLIFKLIRLVGRFPNVHYLLAYDERTILDVLRRSELAYDSDERAQDYLQKIVQIRLDLPPLHEDKQSELVAKSISRFFSANNLIISDFSWSRFSRMYQEVFKVYLREPRAINRFMAQLHALYPLVHGEIDVADFIATTFLRTFEPGFYKAISFHRDRAVRRPTADLDRDRDFWVDLMDECKVSERRRRGLIRLVDVLFGTVGSGSPEYGERRRGINSIDYFDRYFQFGVPQTDISDSVVARAIAGLPDEETPDFVALRTQLMKSPARLLRKLHSLHEDGLIESKVLLAISLGVFYETIPDSVGFDEPPDELLLDLVGKLLDGAGKDQAIMVIRSFATQTESVRLAADLAFRANGDRSKGQGVQEWAGEAAEIAYEALRDRVMALGKVPIDAIGNGFELVRRLSWFVEDDEKLKETLWSAINEGEWTLVEVLGCLVMEGMAGAGRKVIFGLDVGTVDKYLGLERSIGELGENLDGEVDQSHLNREVSPTKEAKELYAIAVLKLHKQSWS